MAKFPNANEEGVASILVVISILAIMLAIALSSSFIVSGEASLSSNISDSAVAYYAAEAGIESMLYNDIRDNSDPVTTCYSSWTSIGNAQYCLIASGSLATNNLAVKSIGEFRSTRRSIEISF